MNLIIKKAAAGLLCAAAAMSASAQFTQSGYFLEDYAYRHLMNPAIANENIGRFVAFPGIGNLNVNMRGNLSLSDFIYNRDGKTVLFTNPGVSNKEAMGNFSDMNKIGTNIRVNVLAFGFRGFGGYNWINLSARTDMNVHLPKSIFSLLKEGVGNKNYEIDGLRAKAIAYGELALGHSRKITDEIRVGAAFKVLLGVGSAEAELERATLSLGKDAWRVTTNANVHTSVKGMYYTKSYNDKTGTEYVDGLDGDFKPINGLGFAVDLGAVYKPNFLPDWEFSAALLDLGFINWKNDLWASTNGNKEFTTDAYTFSPYDKDENNFDDELDRMGDQLETLYQLDDNGNKGGRRQALAATMNLGAAYTLPIYNKVKFGLLNTTHIAGSYTWTDFRLSANYAPSKNVSLGVNGSAGTYGTGLGWIANLRVPILGLQLYLAQDSFFSKLAKQGVPIASNASFSMGLNFVY